MRHRFLVCAFATALMLDSSIARSEGEYTVTDIGAFGVNRSRLYRVNEWGEAAGYSNSCVFWDGDSLTSLDGREGRDLNNAGQVVGWENMGPPNYFNFPALFEKGRIDTLGIFPDQIMGKAWAINEIGDVVGEATYPYRVTHAFLWEQGTVTDLGTLGGSASFAHGINDLPSPTVVGWSHAPTSYVAFSWSSETGIRNLGTLPGLTTSLAYDVNNSNLIVGLSHDRFLPFAVRWVNFKIEKLAVPPGFTYTSAYGVNEAGDIFGCAYNTTADSTAYMWPASGGYSNLNELIDPESFWHLRVAWDGNDEGEIVGYGTNPNGYTHGFVLAPPTPPFTLGSALPARVGVLNTIEVEGATPGAAVTLETSLLYGNTPVPGCPGLSLEMLSPRPIATEIADASGRVIFQGVPPGALRNRVLLMQAVEPTSCRVTNLVLQPFL